MMTFELILWLFVGLAVTLFIKSKEYRSVEQKLTEVDFPKNIVWTLGLVVLGYNIFLFETVPGIGYGFFNLFLIVGLLLSFPKNERRPLLYVLASTSIFAGLALGFRANEFVMDVNLWAMRITLFLILFIYSVKEMDWSKGWAAKYIFQYVYVGFQKLKSLFRFSGNGRNGKNKLILSVLKTTVITAVLLFFFAGLLIQADPVFEKLVDEFADNFVDRTIASIALAFFFLILLTVRFKAFKLKEKQYQLFSYYNLFVPGVLLTGLFAVFLFIQAKYLFGSHQAFTELDITYADYVSKGFIELITAAFFGGLLVYGFYVKHLSLSEKQAKNLRMVSTVLIIALFLMMASALKRNFMYMDVYSLTRVRVIGVVFLAWLAVVMSLLLLMNNWKRLQEREFFMGGILLSALVLVVLNLVNIDQYIADSAPADGRSKDIYYTSVLSPDALEGWKEVISKAETVFEKYYEDSNVMKSEVKTTEFIQAYLALHNIQGQVKLLDEKYQVDKDKVIEWYYDYLLADSYDDSRYNMFDRSGFVKKRKWQSFNLAEYKAYYVIDNNRDLFVDLPDCLIDEYRNYFLQYRYNFSDEIYNRQNNYRNRFVDFKHRVSSVALTEYDSTVGGNVQVFPDHHPQLCR
jgi:hypothetical protein